MGGWLPGRVLASVNEALTFGLLDTSTCQSDWSSSPQGRTCEPERVNGILKLKWPWCIVAHWQRSDPCPPDCANYFEIGYIMYNCAEPRPVHPCTCFFHPLWAASEKKSLSSLVQIIHVRQIIKCSQLWAAPSLVTVWFIYLLWCRRKFAMWPSRRS